MGFKYTKGNGLAIGTGIEEDELAISIEYGQWAFEAMATDRETGEAKWDKPRVILYVVGEYGECEEAAHRAAEQLTTERTLVSEVTLSSDTGFHGILAPASLLPNN
jgi:hypothetical protein